MTPVREMAPVRRIAPVSVIAPVGRTAQGARSLSDYFNSGVCTAILSELRSSMILYSMIRFLL